MNPTFVRLLVDAWGVFRREADLILRLAGMFLFLPALAVRLLCDPMPEPPASFTDPAVLQAWMARVSDWGEGASSAYLLANLIGMFGLAAIALLLLTPDRPSVGAVLATTLRRLGRFVLANLLVAIPVGLGSLFIILPGLYLQARFVAAIPVLAAEPGQSAVRAIGRSWRMTGKASWGILGAVVALFLVHAIVFGPLAATDKWLRLPGHDNPFLIALVDAGLAALETVYQLAVLLLGVVAYGRFARSGT